MDPLTPGSGRFSGLSLPEIYQPAEPSRSAITEVIKDVANGGKLVRWKGFEPSRYCYRQPLKLVRLPVPPPPHKTQSLLTFAARFGLAARGSGRLLRLRLSCNLAQKQSKLYHSSRASRNFCSAAITASESAKRAACSPELSQEPSVESAREFAAARVVS